MRQVYGYQYKKKKPYVNEERAEKLRSMFRFYLDGETIQVAGQKAGIEYQTHEALNRLLRNEEYIGANDYPALMDEELFNQVQERRQGKADVFFYIRECENKTPPEKLRFRMELGTLDGGNPYAKAEQAYSFIKEEK